MKNSRIYWLKNTQELQKETIRIYKEIVETFPKEIPIGLTENMTETGSTKKQPKKFSKKFAKKFPEALPNQLLKAIPIEFSNGFPEVLLGKFKKIKWPKSLQGKFP